MAERPWLEERRARTRRLIELGGLVTKAGLDRATDDDPALLLGALLAVTNRLQRDPEGEVRERWRQHGDRAFNEDAAVRNTRRSSA